MGERNEASADRIGTDELQGSGDAALGMRSPAASATSIRGGAQLAIEMPPQGRAPAEMQGGAACSAAALAAHALHARPELDDDHVGIYMQTAIGRGGYRAALEYYGSDAAKKRETPWSRLRARGWLLGRLGLYDQVGGWLKEADALPGFGYLSESVGSLGRRAPYRTPSLWLESPRPVRYGADHVLTVEPAAAPCHDTGAVPDYIWTAMLILDATGPICSHAGLGAAAFLVEAGADRRAPGEAPGVRRYDPLRGARLHGAPEGCHRWIIADINFDPWLVNEPHYYYDLTDEGRGALDAARAAGAPWPRAVAEAATGLGGMSLPDMLEGACKLHGPLRDLDRMKDELSKVYDAWLGQEEGVQEVRVDPDDRPLVDLGSASKREDADADADADADTGTASDHMLYLATVVKSVRTVACEAAPRSGIEGDVLRVLVGAIQDLCRKHAGAVVAATSMAAPRSASAPRGPAERADCAPRRPMHEDVTPVLISDLYYCLAEYCGSRNLAVDPLSLPLSEQLTEDEKAAVIEALTKDNPLYSDMDRSSRGR